MVVCVSKYFHFIQPRSLSSNQVETSFLGFKKAIEKGVPEKENRILKLGLIFTQSPDFFFTVSVLFTDGHGIISYRDQPAISPGR